MLDSKKSMHKLNFTYCFIVVVACLLYMFGVQFNETTIVNQLPMMDNTLFTNVISTINNFVGNEQITTLFVALITYILGYYFLVVLPFYMFHFVRGLFKA